MFMRLRVKSDKLVFRMAVCLLLAMFITLQGGFLGVGFVNAEEKAAPSADGAGAAATDTGEETSQSKAKGSSGDFISIDMVNADIRDILSAIAINMDVSIIYLNAPVKVSFSAKDVSPEKALELLIQSIDAEGGQLGYIRDGNTIIIGNNDKLQKSFFSQMALTRFKVSYISPAVLSEQLDKLGIPVVKVTLDKSSNYIWVQGTARDLARVSSVISALDRKENFDIVEGQIQSRINLEHIPLKYVTADEILDMIEQLELDVKILKLESNPGIVWITGAQQEMQDVRTLVSQVDVPQSIKEELKMTFVKLKNITYGKLLTVAAELEIPVQIIQLGSSQKALWIRGTQEGLAELNELIAKLDISDNGEEVQFFTYTLRNITPDDAKLRLDFLGISNVSVMTLNFPTVSHEILIKCPYDMIGTVTRVLANIDIQGQKIVAPVDNAVSAYQLTKRKELICRLTGIAAERLTISDNIAKDGAASYYIMWIEDTPDNIKKIKEIVKLMDAQ